MVNVRGRRSAESALVTVPVPGDRFKADLAVAACKARDIECELLTSDESGWGPEMVPIQPHRLLIRKHDQELVERIVARVFTPLDK
jgi:hypothetical protein